MPKDSYASGPSSNPASKSYSGGGGKGGVSSGKTTSKSNSSGANMGGLGVTTGKTIYGNTAFGPAGGMATGYATRTGNISGIGPSMTTFSNFRTPSGSAMFSGQAGNTPVTARNAQQAAGMLSAMQAAQGRRNGFGMLSGDPVTSRPIPAMTQIPPHLQLSIPPAPSYLPEKSILANWFNGPRRRSMLGGGGMLGYGYAGIGAGAWNPASLSYYGGYRTATPPSDPGYRWNDVGGTPSSPTRGTGYGVGGGGGSGW